MQTPHQTHHAKPKIAKNASSKLPEAFRMQGPISKRATEPVSEDPKYHPAQVKSEIKQKKDVVKGQRKSKNPFLPIKEFIKKASEFTRQMREANNDLNNFDRFAKYSIESEKIKTKYKYENCLTLSVVRKNPNGCLKKVLHVPTLTVHYLKQSLISSNFDKTQLNEWINVINREQESCMRVLQIFWNMPEDYYSLLYQYSQGLLLDSLNESLHALPLSLLRDIAALHLSNSLGIFNSHIILHQEGNTKVIRYIPIYEQSEFSISEMARLKEIMEAEIGLEDGIKIGRKFSWRLGLLILNGYLGTLILSQQILKVQLPLKRCCLFHQIISSNNSLATLYLEIGGGIDEQIADFLCHCLRSKKNVERHIELKDLRRHKYFSKPYNETITLGELITVVDPTFGSHSKFQLNKVARIMDSVGLILQNVSGIELNINAESKGVIHLARQLGMSNEVERVVADLRRVYRSEKN